MLLIAILKLFMAKKVFVLKLTPHFSCKMIIWSQNCPFVVVLWWNGNGDPPFFVEVGVDKKKFNGPILEKVQIRNDII